MLLFQCHCHCHPPIPIWIILFFFFTGNWGSLLAIRRTRGLLPPPFSPSVLEPGFHLNCGRKLGIIWQKNWDGWLTCLSLSTNALASRFLSALFKYFLASNVLSSVSVCSLLLTK
jgi:hypothetical protein